MSDSTGRYHFCYYQPASAAASFGQPQEGNRTKHSCFWLRYPFQQKARTRRAHLSKMLGTLGRYLCAELTGVRETHPWIRNINLVLQPQPGRPHSGAMRQKAHADPHPGPVCGPARRGHLQFWCRKLIGNCSPTLLHEKQSGFHHCFQETISFSSATHSQQACRMIIAASILK